MPISDNTRSFTTATIERLGLPTILLLLLLWGLYQLMLPVSNAWIDLLQTQTHLLRDMAEDSAQIRVLAEADASERKSEKLDTISQQIKEYQEAIEARIIELKEVCRNRDG